jgi:tetratricopeptide (TPR) repeat protein
MNRYPRALEIWEQALERYPDIPGAKLTHAKLLYYNGFSAAAEAIMREMLAASPQDAELHMHIGDLRFASGDLAAAKLLYEQALALDAQLPHALYQRGQIAEREGDLEAAVRSYLEVLARVSHPAQRESLLARARLAALTGGAGIQPQL